MNFLSELISSKIYSDASIKKAKSTNNCHRALYKEETSRESETYSKCDVKVRFVSR